MSITHLDEFVQMLMQMSSEKVIEKIKDKLMSDDIKIIEETVEVISKLGLGEMKEDLIKIKERGLLTDRIDEILDELN
jgi:hypothetical protein